jgi:hypothetical protein
LGLFVLVLWGCLFCYFGTVCFGTLGLFVLVLWGCLFWYFGAVCFGALGLFVLVLWGCLFWYFGTVCFVTLASFSDQWESAADRILTSFVALQTVLSEVTACISFALLVGSSLKMANNGAETCSSCARDCTHNLKGSAFFCGQSVIMLQVFTKCHGHC